MTQPAQSQPVPEYTVRVVPRADHGEDTSNGRGKLDGRNIAFAELRRTFATNMDAMFQLTQAALSHLKADAGIIDATLVHAEISPPKLIACNAIKVAFADFTAGLGNLLAKRGIWMNCAAAGPIL